ncbi:glycosyltransferase family 2 protein [Gordonia sp. NPDC003424]
MDTDIRVSIGLPVRNGVERIENVVRSVLAQDHENIELVISDNASTDGTGDLCRELAAQDKRVVFHSNDANIGLFNNYVNTMRLATGTFFRWIGDDDVLAPNCLSRALAVFASDERLILVTSGVSYTLPNGTTQSPIYECNDLRSDDPITRFAEMLRLINEETTLVDPLYGLMRRASTVVIRRRNMLREDEVFATKMALAGPWGHTPEVLVQRHLKVEKQSELARKLDVPAWQAHFATTLQCREILRALPDYDLNEQQRSRARKAVAGMFVRRQRIVVKRRSSKLVRLAKSAANQRGLTIG